jgi:hypothetical protein
MTVDSHKPRIARRLALLGASAVLGATGLSTYLVVSAHSAKPVHLSSSPVHVAAAAPAKAAPRTAAVPSAADPDNIQQGDQSGQDQSGQQDNSGGPDTAAGSTSESNGSEPDGPGGHTDPSGSSGQQGDFNN